MRDALRPFEGQLVAWRGHLKEFGHRPGLICFTNCVVAPWDRNAALNKAIKSPEAIEVDHLWVDVIPDGAERYSRCCAIARVGWYTRADGSVDLGLSTQMPNVSFDHFRDDLNALTPANATPNAIAEGFELLNQYIAQHDAGELQAWSNNWSIDEIREEVADHALFMRRCADATEKALATVQQNGRCDGLHKVSRLPGRQLKRASGFA